MGHKFYKFLTSHIFIKILSFMIMASGAVVALNGLFYSNLNITIEGSILLVIGVVIFLTFDPKITDIGIIIIPKKKRNQR